MFSLRSVLASSAILAASLASPFCQAQTLEVVTAGSSAQWGVFSEAAFALAKAQSPSHNAFHFTVKGNCPSGPCAFLEDHRSAGVPNESGNLWVVWNTTTSGTPDQIWAYLSVDSVVGVRSFSAFPRSTLQIDSAAADVAANQTNLLDFAVSTGTGAVFPDADTPIPSAVLTALSGAQLTAANTDVRPEDALFATNRALAPLDTSNANGLGYTAGTGITDQLGGEAFVEPFALFGTDPLTGEAIPAANLYKTVPIGAAPIIFLGNTSNTATGHLGDPNIKNLAVSGGTNEAEALFSGTNCTSAVFGATTISNVNPILREPTSGTMNTTEFTNFRIAGEGSQEIGINDTNPVTNLPCSSGGSRSRAIGTGNEVNLVKAAADNIGYLFFAFEAAPPQTISSTPATIAYKYLQLDSVDPINATYSTGALPLCNSATLYNCTATNSGGIFTDYPNLRSGSYRSWIVYRLISDANGSNLTNAQTLVNVAEAVADAVLPDFVPLAPVCSGTAFPSGVTLNNATMYPATEPGLQVFRQHFIPGAGTSLAVTLPTTHPPYNPTVDGIEQPNDGPNLNANVTCGRTVFHSGYLGGMDPSATNSEVGGDVGGSIVITTAGTTATPPGPTGSRD